MPHKKSKRESIIDEFFGKPFFGDVETAFEELSEGGGFGSGYSMNVVQTPEGTKVQVKVGKDVNVNTLRKQLQQKYPGAKIEIEGGKSEPLIREISTKPIKKEKEDDET
ncbi:hypothetical protein KAU30_02180 [Candidatus Bathyarchaeota archaeon]|nr:hypothetical protein [Candidatus Bathyarchaeota archaeon]